MARLDILLGIMLLSSCKPKVDNDHYKYYWAREIRKHHHDTIFFRQKTTIKNDSFVLECEVDDPIAKIPFRNIFIFNLKEKTKVYNNNAHESRMVFMYMNDTIIRVSKHNYQVYKYLEDDTAAYDAATNYYWCPEIGIVLIRNVMSGGSRLYTNNVVLDNTVQQIVDGIHEW